MILYTTSFRGIGQITAKELRHRFGNALSKITTSKVRDYDLVQFDLQGDPIDAQHLGTCEDVFVWLADIPITGNRNDLNTLSSTLEKLSFNPALQLHKKYNKPPRGRTSYRAIVQASMQPWQSYRRNQIQHAAEKSIRSKYSNWRLVPDDANLEFWLQQIDKHIRIGLRLTDHTMRHRTYKTASRPASLRPTIARAIVQLTRPADNDIFLDPMCGAGTLMIERALAGRYALVQGGDMEEKAVDATLENFGNQHKPREVRHWDARKLPLLDHSVDKIATNPPWGRQIGSPSELRALYKSAFAEMDRVLRPNGIVAVLTSEWNIIKNTLEQTNLTLIEQIKNIGVLGRRADIFVAQKFTS